MFPSEIIDFFLIQPSDKTLYELKANSPNYWHKQLQTQVNCDSKETNKGFYGCVSLHN